MARDKKKVAEGLRRIRARVRAQVDSLKARPCMDCGGTFDPFVMDFDHREGEVKEFAVSAAVPMGFRLDRILVEVAKCDVVCANCHRMRTKRRLDRGRMETPPGRGRSQDRTHCPKGHEYTPENTRHRPGKGRQCRACWG